MLTWLSLAMAGNLLSQNSKKNVRHFVAFSTFSNAPSFLDVRWKKADNTLSLLIRGALKLSFLVLFIERGIARPCTRGENQ